MIDRRKFLLASVASAVFAQAYPSFGTPQAYGRMNLGLDGMLPSDLWYPLLNAWKMSDELEIFSTTAPADGNLRSDVPPKQLGAFGNESAWQRLDGTVYLTTAGELINPLPADATHLKRLFQTVTTNILPNPFTRTGEAWVLKFDGVATTVSIALDNVVRVGNRITGTWPSGLQNRQISFTGIDHNNPPINIRFCPVAWEARLDAGELYNPDWLAEIKRGSGLLRFMDLMSTNSNRSTRNYSDIPLENLYSWTSYANTKTSYLKGGIPLSAIVNLSRQCRSHAWVCIPHVFGTPKTAKLTAITRTNPPVVTSVNHPFGNGDQVIPYEFDGMLQSATVTLTIASPCVITWTGHPLQASNAITLAGGTLPTNLAIGNAVYVKDVLGVDTFTVSATPGGAAINTSGSQSGTHTATTQIVRNTFTVANATADAFELAGVNATGFSAMVGGVGWLTSPYSLSGMTTEMTAFATYFRDNTPLDLETWFEFSNEAWNSIFDSFHWLAAQARAKFANDNSYKMTGYLLAHCMKTIRDVFGTSAAARRRWKGVLATFTINTTVTNDIIAGINQYISENAPTLTINDLVDAIAVVGYWGGNLIPAFSTISTAWRDDSITRFEAGLEPTRYTYFNRMINEDLSDGRYTGLIFSVEGIQTFWPAQKAIADANNLLFVQYEAGNSNALADGGGSMSGNALWREFFPESTQTPEDASNYQTMLQAFIDLGGTYPAKYTEANPVNIFGSFGALRYPGDTNRVWNTVVDFNNKSLGMRP